MTKINQQQRARELRESGMTITDIAKDLNVSKNSVNKWIKGITLSMEQRHLITSKRNKYHYNINLFREPSELTYYLLGAFISDGWVDRNTRKAGIVSKDKEWLELIGNVLCPNKPVKKRHDSECYELTVNSKYIAHWLMSNECAPHKSLIVKIPDIPPQFVSHFVRGVFDGDGCVSLIKRINSKTHLFKSYIVSGSCIFAESLSKLLNNLGINNYITVINNDDISIFGREAKDYNSSYRVECSGTNALKFCQFIYLDKNIFLARKFLVLEQYLEIRKWELENCQIRKQFDDPKKILKLLESHTYGEVAAMYGITRKTVIDRLKKSNLYEIAKLI